MLINVVFGILGVVVVLIVLVLILASFKPNVFQIQREANIKAPPAIVFALINDFHRWIEWSPWEKMDPNLKRTYSGSERGLGAIYEWEGNKKVGKGRMEIIESSPASKIRIKLDFLVPFEAHNIADFTLAGQGNSTEVTWVMSGPSPLMMKVMHLFMDMDSMIGKDFESGLSNMKAIAEK